MWLLILTSLVLLLTHQLNLHLFFVFLKPKKDNLSSGAEESPWPLGKYKNEQSRRKFQNQQPGFRKPGYFLWLPSYFGIRWGDDIYCSLFHLLNLKCWWCWHAGFTTLCHENILPITLRSQVIIVRGLALLLLSPPNEPDNYAMPRHRFDTRQSMFLLCLVIPGRSKSSLAEDYSDCSEWGISVTSSTLTKPLLFLK